MSATHTLVIKTDGNDIDGLGWDVDYEIECPDVDDACRNWNSCLVHDCPLEANTDASGERIAHGERHRYLDESWCVPTDTCYLMIADELPDVAEDLATKEGLSDGRYEVEHDFDEGRLAILTYRPRMDGER